MAVVIVIVLVVIASAAAVAVLVLLYHVQTMIYLKSSWKRIVNLYKTIAYKTLRLKVLVSQFQHLR